jgi:peptidoglycan hydrolase-like protein with peptidoglycan-binding domain
MKAKPIFIAVAAMFSAAAIAGGQGASQGSSSADQQSQSQQPQSQQSSSASSASAQNPEIVKQAQEKLSAAGHEVQPDGKMGPKTQAAVKEFQQKEGLQASGQLDQQTLAALEIGTPEGTTTGSSTGSSSAGSSSEGSSTEGSSSAGASGGSSSAGSSSERTAEPANEPSTPSKSQ